MSKLKLLKKMHKINQEDLTKVLGTNRVQISRYETGKQKLDEDKQTKHAARISRGVFVCAQTKVASKQAGKTAERRKEQPGGSADKSREFSYTSAADALTY